MLATAGKRRTFIRIERPLADSALDGAGSGTWDLHEEVWAEVQDALPSRGERLADGISVTEGPARVRTSFVPDVTAAMRIVDVDGGRIMQIVGRPAILGNREGLEFMVVEFSPAGNTA